MDRDSILAILRPHEQEFRAAGVASMSLFGSAARGEPNSQDVDIAIRVNENFSKPGLDFFGRLDDLERTLAKLLAAEVDVVEEPARKSRFQHEIDKDRIVAF